MDAYERVPGDAMAGDATLFAREDYVEEAWRIVDPVLKELQKKFGFEPDQVVAVAKELLAAK
jgi:glucose-6-phosphate 1-dehydrogenase